MLDIKAEDMIGKHYKNVVGSDYVKMVNKFLRNRSLFRRGFMERQVRLSFENKTLTLLVSLNVLRDDRGKYLGLVAVFEDLSEIEKAQRMAAWREVARRIAHEVKNPLTPIQLSAQRLRKKYLHTLESDKEVFDLCTQTIINQVEELKRLVSEFSSFARMPIVQKRPNDLVDMVREILVFYEESYGSITFCKVVEQDIPRFNFDLKQMKRVLINLLENSIAFLHDGGVIEIVLWPDIKKQVVFMAVKDNGPGVADEDKLRLFEPYFSTKKSGSGLGLAIASTVVSDHGGSIRVTDNTPIGAIFTVELPMSG